jgi:hypothetical protein
MTWINPPPTVLQLRTQLLLCPTVIGTGALQLGMTSASFHYPTFNPTQASPNVPAPDLMPCAWLADMDSERERYAEGAIGLLQGELAAVFYVGSESSTIYDVGSCETMQRQILIDLDTTGYFGLTFKRKKVKISSDPRPGQQGAQSSTGQANYRMFSLSLTYGLSRGRT